MLARLVVSFSLLVVAAAAVFAAELAPSVGSITTVAGDVFIVRDGERTSALKGSRLLEHDVLQTAADGSVAAVLRDDTTFSLGPSSEMKMSEFRFEPDRSLASLTLGMVKGTLVYVSGKIAKLAPGAARIETPSGVAAVRGTQLLVQVE